MKNDPTRREFLKASLAAAYGAGLAPRTVSLAVETPSLAPLPIKKGVLLGMLPKNMSYADRFKLARDVGFDVVQAYTTPDEREAEEIKKASDGAAIRIDTVMNMAHWENPLSSSDPAVVARSMEGMKTSFRNAKLWGSDAVLLVPAVVNPKTSYRDAWTRSQAKIREMIPMAEELKILIAIEEVWNKFLLSPLEFATYIDEFKSPWVQAWFDVGNVVLYGYPQDWIRTLGKRIAKVHLKDFRTKKGWSPLVSEFVNLGDGDIDWAEVRNAFREIGYAGSATTEIGENHDEAFLRDLSARVDRLVLGKM